MMSNFNLLRNLGVALFLPTTSTSFSSRVKITPNIPRPPLPGHHPDYPFENVVFQGGGGRGAIYGGVAAGLEKLGVLPYLKRFAGTSIGSVPALLMALGLDSKQIQEEMMRTDTAKFLDGHLFDESLKSIPGMNVVDSAGLAFNFFDSLGMHPAQEFTNVIADVLERYGGNSEMTFSQLYHKFGTELCVVVSNLSRSETSWCHVNITPNLKIKDAIRASMSIPFVFQPCYLYGTDETSVDGGLYNNYPIEAFDGWYLSTDPSQGIFPKMQSLMGDEVTSEAAIKSWRSSFRERFVGVNPATIGFRIYDESDRDTIFYVQAGNKYEEENKNVNDCDEEIPLPDTRKAREYKERRAKEALLLCKKDQYEYAFKELFSWTLKHFNELRDQSKGVKHPHGISTSVYLEMLNNDPSVTHILEALGDATWEEVMKKIDLSRKGYIIRSDLTFFWCKYGVRLHELGNREPIQIDSPLSLFLECIFSMQRLQEDVTLSDKNNFDRTCTLNTVYVGVLDFDLEDEDKEFAYKIGERDSIKWLKSRAAQLKRKEQKKITAAVINSTLENDDQTNEQAAQLKREKQKKFTAGVINSTVANDDQTNEQAAQLKGEKKWKTIIKKCLRIIFAR